MSKRATSNVIDGGVCHVFLDLSYKRDRMFRLRSPWQNELIRDRIVVGLGDAKLFEKLQLDKHLTQEKAILTVRQAEQVGQQQVVLCVDLRRLLATSIPCMRIQHRKYLISKNTKGEGTRQQQKVQTGQRQKCKWCEQTPSMIDSNAQLVILLAIHAIRKDIMAPFVVLSKFTKCLKRQHIIQHSAVKQIPYLLILLIRLTAPNHVPPT